MRLKDPDTLRDLMHKGGWSYRSLSRACGLKSHALLYQLATGKRPGCTPAVAFCLADHLDVQPAFLFDTPTSIHTGRTSTHGRRPR